MAWALGTEHFSLGTGWQTKKKTDWTVSIAVSSLCGHEMQATRHQGVHSLPVVLAFTGTWTRPQKASTISSPAAPASVHAPHHA